MRIAMIGLGDIAHKAYLPVVAAHPHITPVICTRNADILKKVQQQYRITEAYNNVDAVLRSMPDAVMVHTNTQSHYSIVKRCLLAGIPVFVDKPVSYHYRQCAELVNLAAQKQVPLLVGFNRRFAPLYQSLKSRTLRQVHYQKNRLNLPALPREFVFDDFIHVLDFVCHCSLSHPEDIDVFSSASGEQLAAVQVQWQQDDILFTASMNRLHGRNEEQLRYITTNEYWEINNLSSGTHFSNGNAVELGFGDWEPTLVKRGFVAMVEHLLLAVNEKQSDAEYVSILDTHELCEKVVTRVG